MSQNLAGKSSMPGLKFFRENGIKNLKLTMSNDLWLQFHKIFQFVIILKSSDIENDVIELVSF